MSHLSVQWKPVQCFLDPLDVHYVDKNSWNTFQDNIWYIWWQKLNFWLNYLYKMWFCHQLSVLNQIVVLYSLTDGLDGFRCIQCFPVWVKTLLMVITDWIFLSLTLYLWSRLSWEVIRYGSVLVFESFMAWNGFDCVGAVGFGLWPIQALYLCIALKANTSYQSAYLSPLAPLLMVISFPLTLQEDRKLQ